MLKSAVFLLAVGLVTKGLLGAMVDVTPKESMVLPGQNSTFRCRVAVPLQYCRIEIPGFATLNLNKGSVNKDVSYTGYGLDAGDCGFTIHRVLDKNNGDIKCTLGIPNEATESIGTMQLIVAKQPSMPELELSTGPDSVRLYKVGDVLNASCMVRDGRPVANITWYLDDDLINESELKMPTIVEFAKENLHTKIQNLTRILRASDNGRHLRCVAYHPTYPSGFQETKRMLDITFPPQPATESLDRFGYQVGKEGLVNVTFLANPRPQIKWKIISGLSGQMIEIDQEGSDKDGRIVAEELKDLGRGAYLANLRIAAVNKQDTEKDYVLYAYNNLGTQQYTVKISTSPEPEGVDWAETGTIVAVVVVILLIILIVSILIFARVTGRWCFTGGRELRNLGESSDTESADVRPRETKKATPPLKFTSIFKKNKDKVASEEAPESKRIETEEEKSEDAEDHSAKPEDEPREGLVYAELDLVRADMKPVVKNDDEKTEYAEIVYTPNTNREETAKESETPPTK